MRANKSTIWPTLTLSSLNAALATALSTTVLTVAPLGVAQAQTTCAAAWSSTAIYTAGDVASENDIKPTDR